MLESANNVRKKKMLESGCYEKWERTNYYTMMKSIYEAQVAAKVDVPVSASVKECRKFCKAGSWNPLGDSTGGTRRLWRTS